MRGAERRDLLGDYANMIASSFMNNTHLVYGRSLLWDAMRLQSLRLNILPIGFSLLDTWQIAAPVWSYTELAAHVGNAAEREYTQSIIRDLRVLMYDTRMVFVRRCGDTRKFVSVWRDESEKGADERLAFLRALYIVKPVLLALPTTWTKAG